MYPRTLRGRLRRQLRKPFKGSMAYEWQIGPVVCMFWHGQYERKLYLPIKHAGLKRFRFWYDRNWWTFGH